MSLLKKLKAFNVFRLYQSQAIDSPPFDKFFNGSLSKMVSKLNTEIDDKKAHAEDPPAAAWRKLGFAPLWDVLPFLEDAIVSEYVDVPEGEVAYFIRLQDDVVFGVVEIRERMVPGDVLRSAVDKECLELESRQGEPVTRKQRMEIKDVVVARLLATALIKVKQVPVAFVPDALQDDVFNVVVFNGSRKVCEDVTALFRQVFVSFPVRSIDHDYELPLQILLTAMVTSPEHCTPYNIMPGTAVKLVSNVSGEYSLKDEPLQNNDHLTDLLENQYQASRLMIRHWQRGIVDDSHVYSQFTLNSKAAFTSLKLSDVMVAEVATDDDNAWLDFSAFTFMLFNELAEMLGNLERYANWVNSRYEPEDVTDAEPVDEDDENDQL